MIIKFNVNINLYKNRIIKLKILNPSKIKWSIFIRKHKIIYNSNQFLFIIQSWIEIIKSDNTGHRRISIFIFANRPQIKNDKKIIK